MLYKARRLYIGVVFCELDSFPRTDLAFHTFQFEDHHIGECIPLRLDINMVKDIPLEPMHLVKLGVSRKLILTWIGGLLDRGRNSKFFFVFSSRGFTNSHFKRKTEKNKSRNCVLHFAGCCTMYNVHYLGDNRVILDKICIFQLSLDLFIFSKLFLRRWCSILFSTSLFLLIFL